MKLNGFSVTLPFCDLRPFVSRNSRLDFISRLPLDRPRQAFLRGFGPAEERTIRIPWRDYDNVHFLAKKAFSFSEPLGLPLDNIPIIVCVRRLFLDGQALGRFEVAQYSHYSNEVYPQCRYDLNQYAQEFWNSLVFKCRIGDSKQLGKRSALRELIKDYVESTTPHKFKVTTPMPHLCQMREPQLQVLVEATSEELGRRAIPLDEKGNISIRFDFIDYQEWPNVDTVYIAHQRGVDKDRFRMVRAHITGLHADWEVLTGVIGGYSKYDIPFSTRLIKYLSELTKRLCTPQDFSDCIENQRRFPDLKATFKVFQERYSGRIAALIKTLEKTDLPQKVREEIGIMLRGCLSN